MLLALNLRVAVASIGVALEGVRSHLGMPARVGGIVTTRPVVRFAVFGVGPGGAVRQPRLHRAAGLLALFDTIVARRVMLDA